MEDEKGHGATGVKDRPAPVERRSNLFGGIEELLRYPFDELMRGLPFLGEHRPYDVEIADKGNAYELRLAIPGVRKEDIELTYDERSRTIAMHTMHRHTEETGGVRQETIRDYEWMRAVLGIDGNGITATYEDGVLIATLPKQVPEPAPEPKRIPISGTEPKTTK